MDYTPKLVFQDFQVYFAKTKPRICTKKLFFSGFSRDRKPRKFRFKTSIFFCRKWCKPLSYSEILAEIEDKENYILQRKVQYASLFEDINGEFSKAEIRMLYLWKEDAETPQLMDNLVRMTKAEMVNVNFNKKDAIWIGSSIAFFEK
jgi:hypothetical protein